MTTFYTGKRPVLKGRSDTANTYTGLIGRYSNWDLMYTSHVLDGAPDSQHTPGVAQDSGGGEGDVVLSSMFTGAAQALYFKFRLAGAYNKVPPASVSYFYGNFPYLQYQGITVNYSGEDGSILGHRPIYQLSTYGHLLGAGPSAPYALWDYYYHGLANNRILGTSTLGHIARYPQDNGPVAGLADLGEPWDAGQQAATFGSFQPYLYKGVAAAFGSVGGGTGEEEFVGYGHDYYAAGSVGTANDHYGDEHVREWFGVTSAKALGSFGTVAGGAGSNTYPTLAPKL